MNVYVKKKLLAKMEKELAAAAAAGTSIGQLPNNILVDILSRLPIKSVIRCRCVCKSFLFAISQDPEFRPLHLSRSPPELILSRYTEQLFLVDDYDDNEEPRYHQLNLLRFEGSYNYYLEALNSTRGLLCVHIPYSCRPLCVFNPFTLEYTLIPPPLDLIGTTTKYFLLNFGFGYSPITDKYKALAIVQYKKTEYCTITTTTTFTAIYTVGSPSSSSWRRIQEDAPDVFFDKSPTYLNGSLYWIVTKKCHYYILSFDFDNEKFGEIAMPPPFDTVREKWFDPPEANLSVFEGLLSVCVLTDRRRVDLWVMKDCMDVNKSWYKELVVETVPDHVWSWGAFPLKYVNKDKEEVLLDFMGDDTLVKYNLIEKKIVKLNSLPFYNGTLKPLMHVPILLPLKDLIIGAEVHLITDARHQWKEWIGNSVSSELESTPTFENDSEYDSVYSYYSDSE
ncbi:F-box protein CPR1-like [Impatiens glandulifera]|uniref:F-box protein CPR1-like n=1 Tax=Impatiens glandulifera TaxID=253017 RepID=UPI001FB05CC2|nr:F-box protein CPR1-like [Impatiens glandulifera]